jgi:hypothetical protein
LPVIILYNAGEIFFRYEATIIEKKSVIVGARR